MIGRAGSLALLFLVACGGGQAPVIESFSARPDLIHAGETTTLSWSVRGATQISIDQGVGIPRGPSATVAPAATTTYTLTASGAGGEATATAKISVLAPLPRPLITQFGASPDDVPSGTSAVLSWKVAGEVAGLSLSDGRNSIDVTGQSSKSVLPDTLTTYTLTATNSGGSDKKQVQVNVHSPSLRLQYSDPGSTTAKIKVVKNPSSTPNRLQLDVKVGDAPLTAFGVAMNIPLARRLPADPTASGPFRLDAGLTPPGLLVNGAIQVGASPSTAAVVLGGPAMPGFISIGVAKHKAGLADGDAVWPAGSTLFSVVLLMVGSPATGEVFLGSSLGLNPWFRAAALRRDGTEAVGRADIALGDFIISL